MALLGHELSLNQFLIKAVLCYVLGLLLLPMLLLVR